MQHVSSPWYVFFFFFLYYFLFMFRPMTTTWRLQRRYRAQTTAYRIIWALSEYFFFIHWILYTYYRFSNVRKWWAPVLLYYAQPPTRPCHHTKLPAASSSSRGWGLETGVSRALRGIFFFSSFFDYTNLFTFTVITTELVPEPVPAPALAPAPAPTAYEKRPKRCETRRLGPKWVFFKYNCVILIY